MNYDIMCYELNWSEHAVDGNLTSAPFEKTDAILTLYERLSIQKLMVLIFQIRKVFAKIIGS